MAPRPSGSKSRPARDARDADRGRRVLRHALSGEGNYLLDVAALAAPEVGFYVAPGSPAALAGCGALVVRGARRGRGCAELKRMYVDPRLVATVSAG